MAKPDQSQAPSCLPSRIMRRHAAFYGGLVCGIVFLLVALLVAPKFAVSIGANGMFLGILVLSAIKLPHLTADYLREHARDEDTPGFGIFLVVVVVIVASVVSLVLALNNGGQPDPFEVVLSVLSVILGWFTVQVIGAFHYAYEYYQVPQDEDEEAMRAPEQEELEGEDDSPIVGGLDFPGRERPDGTAFMYFSFTVGTSVATSDTKLTSNAMRRRVTVHLVFSHLFNTIILAAAVGVLLGSGGG
jgi:uncharacterized membrane protein